MHPAVSISTQVLAVKCFMREFPKAFFLRGVPLRMIVSTTDALCIGLFGSSALVVLKYNMNLALVPLHRVKFQL